MKTRRVGASLSVGKIQLCTARQAQQRKFPKSLWLLVCCLVPADVDSLQVSKIQGMLSCLRKAPCRCLVRPPLAAPEPWHMSCAGVHRAGGRV